MKAIDRLLYLLCFVGALAGYLFLAPPLSWCAVAACVAFAVWTLLASERASATARWAVLVNRRLRARLAHHGTHWIGQDTVCD